MNLATIDTPVAPIVDQYDRHNEVIDTGTVSFELNQTTAETVDIEPSGRDDNVALVVYNPGTADVSIEVSTLITRGETLTAHQLVSGDDLSVPAGTGRTFLVNGWGVCEGTRLSLTPASGVAAFNVSYEVYRR